MSGMLKVLSLGAGVQSSTLLLMSCRGDLPKLDAAIFADTKWEPKDVYRHLEWLEGEAKTAGIPVYRVTAGNLREHAAMGVAKKTKDGQHYISLPIHTVSPSGVPGMVRQRQCTRDYKIVPIQRKIRELLGLRKGQRWPREPAIDQWFGITADEAGRMRTPRHRAIIHRYPFIQDMLTTMPGVNVGVGFDPNGRRWTRQHCINWLATNYPGRKIPRSACIGCPFHNNSEWRRIKAEPDEWRDAVDFDEKIRDMRAGARTDVGFIHKSRQPLESADLTEADESASVWNHECEGMCGV